MAHTCHAYGCNKRVKPEFFMCFGHWNALPLTMKRRIWQTYRAGQCDDWQISKEYAEAAKACIRHVAEKENKVIPDNAPELELYDRLSE